MILSIKKKKNKNDNYSRIHINRGEFLTISQSILNHCHEILQALFFIDGSTTHEILYSLKFDMK